MFGATREGDPIEPAGHRQAERGEAGRGAGDDVVSEGPVRVHQFGVADGHDRALGQLDRGTGSALVDEGAVDRIEVDDARRAVTRRLERGVLP